MARSSSPIRCEAWEATVFLVVMVQPRTVSDSDVQDIPRGESVRCFKISFLRVKTSVSVCKENNQMYNITAMAALMHQVKIEVGTSFNVKKNTFENTTEVTVISFRVIIPIYMLKETIKIKVCRYADTFREKVVRELQMEKEKGQLFSLTLDEWTSIRSKRYLNINIHSRTKVWNLGLTRISGVFSSEQCKYVIGAKLLEFGIDFETDIVCVTTDGCAMMMAALMHQVKIEVEHHLILRKILLKILQRYVEMLENETIKIKVCRYADTFREKVVRELQMEKEKGQLFSLTLDEWTSIRSKRYLNINIHSRTKVWNLGLTRISGVFSSEQCKYVIGAKLLEFGIDFETDIVCVTTDGCAMMVKLGHIIGPLQQLCYAHGLHLAVMDVLYGLLPNTALRNVV
ncbi:hypothetical protein LAZ67_1004295 [Cordylochernes scorpioides]|uniref:Uncharacterized protein n=1 Tax=Cordylochernes scorpioides TaxID=51811 RepID=A0ABY6JZ47_9ARAC|nr:hypothetical protein LAZ67_1004295 [Cordylochernes scorpioides]